MAAAMYYDQLLTPAALAAVETTWDALAEAYPAAQVELELYGRPAAHD